MKRKFTLVILPLFLVVAAWSQTSTQVVRFKGLDNKKGKIYVAWYNSDDDFMKPQKAVINKVVDVSGKESVDISFDTVPAGTYAISAFFDENSNGKLDTNGLGIPKENYGFSNNVRPLTRAANFEEAKFEVKGKGEPIVIELK